MRRVGRNGVPPTYVVVEDEEGVIFLLPWREGFANGGVNVDELFERLLEVPLWVAHPSLSQGLGARGR